MLYYIGLWIVRFAYFLAFRIQVEGKENILRHGGIVLASNHRSNADPPLLATRLPGHRCVFMAKEELFRNPVFGWLIRHLGAFPVTRGSGDTGVIDVAVQHVKNGRTLMIFPEGTRSKDGRVGRGKTGVAVVAAKTGADVIPVGISFQGKLHFRSKIIIRFGKPIAASSLALSADPRPKELGALKTMIMTEIRSLVDEPPLPEPSASGEEQA